MDHLDFDKQSERTINHTVESIRSHRFIFTPKRSTIEKELLFKQSLIAFQTSRPGIHIARCALKKIDQSNDYTTENSPP